MAVVVDNRKLLSQLKKLRSKKSADSAVAGYVMPYSLIVHEIHPTLSKYLTNPLNEMVNDGSLGQAVVDAVMANKGISQTLLHACEKILERSQPAVPVDTGALKQSGFACLEKDIEKESIQHGLAGMAIRYGKQAAVKEKTRLAGLK